MQIKFRLYDRLSAAMYDHEEGLKHIKNRNIKDLNVFADRRFICQLYSGITDKYGIQICEGDILETVESKNNKMLYLVIRNELGDFVIDPFYKKRYGVIPVRKTVEYRLEDIQLNKSISIIGNNCEDTKTLLGGRYNEI